MAAAVISGADPVAATLLPAGRAAIIQAGHLIPARGQVDIQLRQEAADPLPEAVPGAVEGGN